MRGQPIDHPIRLEALAETRLLDSLPEESYDRFTRLACTILHTEVSLVTLVAGERQYFKSEYGLGEPLRTIRQTDVSRSFCRFVVETGEPFIVENAPEDPRVNQNPAVTEPGGVVSYLGMPICTNTGDILGTLCAFGTAPRIWSSEDQANLADLAFAVSREIELSQQSDTLHRSLNHSQSGHQQLENDLRHIVHDLRTPAGAITSCLELITLSDDPFSEETLELLEVSRESAESLLEMIQQILVKTPPKVESGEMQPESKPISASLLLRHVARVIQPSAHAAQVTLDFIWPDQLILLHADERLIERVLLNLLSNAVKYSPSGGTVRITLGTVVRDGNLMCRISVIDQGPGVPDVEKALIFDESFKGSIPSQRGMQSFGIGLAFCKTVVESHGGGINVQDTPGGGSEFSCLLPCTV